MNKITLILIAVLASGLSSAFAGGLNCNNADQVSLAKEAKHQAHIKFQLLQRPGITGVGVANCDPRYLARELGLPTNGMPNSPVCGVSVLFKDKKAEKAFALWAFKNLPHGKFPVQEGHIQILVPYCGEVTGSFGPQPGVSVSN